MITRMEERPAKRPCLSDPEERFTDKTWFNAEIGPRLGPATTIVLRLVCKRFHAWCKPPTPYPLSAVVADIVEQGLGAYYYGLHALVRTNRLSVDRKSKPFHFDRELARDSIYVYPQIKTNPICPGQARRGRP